MKNYLLIYINVYIYMYICIYVYINIHIGIIWDSCIETHFLLDLCEAASVSWNEKVTGGDSTLKSLGLASPPLEP